MAGPFIGNIFMECEGRGWTETYYPLGGNYSACVASLQTICSQRSSLALPDVLFVNLRVSDMTIRGDSLNAVPTNQFGTYVDVADNTSDPDFAVLARQNGVGSLVRAVRYLRGIPEKVFNFNPLRLATAPTTWQSNLDTFFSIVKSNSQLVERHAGSPPTFTTTAIDTIIEERATIRRAGRPFGQQPGRRLRA